MRLARGTAGVVGVALVALLIWCGTASAATITVDTTDDDGTVSADCELREAIEAANTNAAVDGCTAGEVAPVADLIEFSIAGSGPHVFSVSTDLQALAEAATIDGTSDPDVVRLDGTESATEGFNVSADDVTIKGLEIVNFTFIGIDVGPSDGVVIGGAGDAGNLIGTDAAGTAGLGPGSRGIRIGAGGAVTNAEVRGNVVAGYSFVGIRIEDANSTGNVIAGNRLGTNPAGDTALTTGLEGVTIADGADANTIGGPDAADRNLISGHGSHGVYISHVDSDRATGNIIQRNRIGTSADGESAIPNSIGIALNGAVDQTEVRDNLVSGNAAQQIYMADSGSQPGGEPGPSQNVIAGNRIGTDKDGVTDISAGTHAVQIGGASGTGRVVAGNVIGGVAGLAPGGACSGDCNVIGGAGPLGLQDHGVHITGTASGTQVLGNHIGVNPTGGAAVANDASGVNVGLDDAAVVGSPTAPNVISGNLKSGIVVASGGSGALVQSNLIGVASDGTTALPNGDHGISVASGTDVTIGGPTAGEGNVVANNGDIGVRVDSGAGNAILGNSIDANGDLGIDLLGGTEDVSGVTANDSGDADAGSNGLQNFPVLSAAVAGASTQVVGSLDSASDADFLIEVFESPVADASGHGEGATSLGSFEVTTGSSGMVTFIETVDGTASAAAEVSATATALDSNGDPLSTSEFSATITEGVCDVPGTSGDDVLSAGAGEVACGLGGDDVLIAADDTAVLLGGEGTDTMDLSGSAQSVEVDLAENATGGDPVYFDEIENVIGSIHADDITGDDAENEIIGGAGADTLEGGGGKDTLEGEDGADTLEGGDGADTLKGGDGADTLKGEDGADTLKGEDGADTLRGGNGADTLRGQDGADTLKGEDGSDTLKGMDGGDTLKGGDGKDTLKGGNGSDTLKGNSGDDTLKGNDGNDTLKGQGDDDKLAGNGGSKDVCDGGGGNGDKDTGGCETVKKIP